MWIGVFLAAALCLGLGVFINETTGEFPQREQELFEGIVAVIAVFILTWMVFWMRKVSRNVKQQLEQAVDNALQRGNNHGWALVMMVFFAVAREGLESVFFLLAAFQQDVGIWPPLGAMLGLATAVVLGFLLYWGGVRLNLGVFFKWTSLFILLVAAGLAAGRFAPSMRRDCGIISRMSPLILATWYRRIRCSARCWKASLVIRRRPPSAKWRFIFSI
ncbi:Ferrous iron transport permease EfeU (plasmid) [Klebsiella aerogenes]|nr:Ferrous iron transport permease EfeU [Klebsiella aerogenes]